MKMSTRSAPPSAAFLSYAHFDESTEAGRISELARMLEGKIMLQIGRPFRIFIDRRDIGWGERWPTRITETLDEALFLIPIITPAYFNSRACRAEYLHFWAREDQLKRTDLVRPIYYVESPPLERARWRSSKSWIANIAIRQYSDWRLLRLRPFDDLDVVRTIENMATEIRTAIQKHKATLWKGTTMTDPIKAAQRSADQIEKSYRDLSRTQRLIVFAMYTLIHPPEMAVDDLLEFLKMKYPDDIDIGSTAELFFRVKDLVNEGLLAVRPVGHKTTVVCGIPRVAKVLHDRQHLST